MTSTASRSNTFRHITNVFSGLISMVFIALTDRVGVSHYVTLHRHNYLRRVVSGAIGRERRRWHRTHAEPAPSTAVRLDPKAVPFGPRQTLLAAFEEMKTGEADLGPLSTVAQCCTWSMRRTWRTIRRWHTGRSVI